MQWLKDNAVSLVFGILGSVTIIGAFASNLYGVICAGPFPFWIWSIGVAVILFCAGWCSNGFHIKRKLGMTIDEAAERLDQKAAEERAAKERYSKLRGLSPRSKAILYDGWMGGGLWDGDVGRNREVLLLADMGFMRELPAENGGPRAWAVSEEVMGLLNGDDGLLGDFQDAAAEAALFEPEPTVSPEQRDRYMADFNALSLEQKAEVFKLLMWEDEPGPYDGLAWMDGLSFVSLEEVYPETFAAELEPGVRELFKEMDEVTVGGAPMRGVLMRVRDYLEDYRPIDPDPEPLDLGAIGVGQPAEVA